MSVNVSLAAIPWSHETSDFGSVWVWETPHFIITVNGNDRSCYYQIADKSANPGGAPKPLADGQAATFEQTELLIRSTIGKSYKPTLGYGIFSGPLATTFMLSNGQQTDLGVYVGQQVEVTTLNPDGTESVYTGMAEVQHYDFVLHAGAIAMRISPSYIVSVKIVGVPSQAVQAPKINRTVEGKVSPGCTGRPGFLSDTVEHTGNICPIHEEGV